MQFEEISMDLGFFLGVAIYKWQREPGESARGSGKGFNQVDTGLWRIIEEAKGDFLLLECNKKLIE